MRRPCTFKKVDVTRAAKAALAAGLEISSVEIDPATGKITIMAKDAGAMKTSTSALDEWIESRASQA
jgi:hypothetical protein